MDVYRAGNITIANAPGTGIADDKAIYSYMPEIVEFYTGRKALLENVPTWRCGEADSLKYVLDHLDELVVKEVHGSGGYGMLVGPCASKAEIRGQPAAERLRVRREKSAPLLAAIKAWMTDKLATLSKKSELAKAIRYSLNQWEALMLYCEEGRAEIGNALAENALRCVSLGRKNFLFAGSDSGGRAGCGDVRPDRHVQAQRDQPARLPRIRPDPYR
ncbi:hypothetical protein BGV57_21355 [Burkholderia ubonensis]|nr:hypothetical protein BGV57_21355 [Burkholderia ubonensis]